MTRHEPTVEVAGGVFAGGPGGRAWTLLHNGGFYHGRGIAPNALLALLALLGIFLVFWEISGIFGRSGGRETTGPRGYGTKPLGSNFRTNGI